MLTRNSPCTLHKFISTLSTWLKQEKLQLRYFGCSFALSSRPRRSSSKYKRLRSSFIAHIEFISQICKNAQIAHSSTLAYKSLSHYRSYLSRRKHLPERPQNHTLSSTVTFLQNKYGCLVLFDSLTGKAPPALTFELKFKKIHCNSLQLQHYKSINVYMRYKTK